MRTPRSRPVFVLALVLASAASAARATETGVLAGRVSGGAAGIAEARVYAYQLSDLTLRRVGTDDRGHFRFAALPAGLYKVIAHKTGFVPVVLMLIRASAEARQFLDLELMPEAAEIEADTGDFWSLREQIPADVLRDIERVELPVAVATSPLAAPEATRFQGEVLAMTGVDQSPYAAAAQLTEGRLGLRGRVGALDVGLTGDFRQLDAGIYTAPGLDLSTGQASALSLQLVSPEAARLDLTSLSNRLVTLQGGKAVPIEFDHYRVSWSQPMGEHGRSTLLAQYTSESNFYRKGWINPLSIPDASRSWRIEGSYATPLGERTQLETGVRYRERYGEFARRSFSLAAAPDQTVDIYGRGAWQLRPAVLVEYGLYTTLRDGSVSLVPRGGVVLQLGDRWQAATQVSHRVDQPGVRQPVDFMPAFYAESEGCEQVDDHCYKVEVTRRHGEDEALTLGVVHRRLGESLRLYFSEEFFDHLENLFLVPGDELPGVQLTFSQRLGPALRARLASDYSEGGGGIVHATSLRRYENDVRYLVASLDTLYEPTATGVFLSFHRLEQRLQPLQAARVPAEAAVELESVELAFTQDLNFLLDLAADWALHLNMEVSRGTTPDAAASDETLRRRVLGGIAVKF